jgi:hypothetical protein
VGWFGFPQANITLLAEKKATRKAIGDALTALRKRAKTNDTLVIYYTGHGVIARAGNTYREALVPYDGKVAEIGTLITNADLTSWLHGLRASRFILLDCCFSGGFRLKSRAYDPTAPVQSGEVKCATDEEVPDDPAVKVEPFSPDGQRGGQVVIYAAKRYATDLIFRIEKNQVLRTSALTYGIYLSVFQQPDISCDELMKDVTSRMNGWKLEQQPGMRGIAQGKLFGGVRAGIRANMLPIAARDRHKIQLLGGIALQVKAGDTVNCLGPDGKIYPRLRVAGADLFSAWATK